ncbi:MAG: hypothetical protein LC793_17935 [Thermomicrobia bacterium]|nr:hypothetical protein [Thermomicrobia bacterium]
MGMYVAMVVTCWLCLAIVTPRKPQWGNEVEELVYTRLLGRQHLLFGITAVMTAALVLALVVTLPKRMTPGMSAPPSTPTQQIVSDPGTPPLLSAYCDATAARSPVCYFPQPEHDLEFKAERQANGIWQVVGTHALTRAIDDGR